MSAGFLVDFYSLLFQVVLNWLVMHGVSVSGQNVVSALLSMMMAAAQATL